MSFVLCMPVIRIHNQYSCQLPAPSQLKPGRIAGHLHKKDIVERESIYTSGNTEKTALKVYNMAPMNERSSTSVSGGTQVTEQEGTETQISN